MKKTVSCLIMAMLILCSSIAPAYAATIEKGDPSAVYSSDKIILPKGIEVDLQENATLFFLNGTLITNYETIIRNGRALVPVRFIAQELGAAVDWEGSNRTVTITKAQKKVVFTIDHSTAFVNEAETDIGCPAILYKELAYIPLKFAAESLDASVTYSSPLSPEYTYYYDTRMPLSPANTIIRDFANIIVDEQYDFSHSLTADEALTKTQYLCLEGLENFSKSLRTNLEDSKEDPHRFDADLESIKKEIDRMLYIGEVSRFYKFTIGPYDILYDRINSKTFFIIYSSGTTVKEVDVNDTGLYFPIFIAG